MGSPKRGNASRCGVLKSTRMPQKESYYIASKCATFRSTREKFGGLSNMAAGFPIYIHGLKFRTSEALYQACRFPAYPGIQARILREKSPLVAKWIARGRVKRYGRKDWAQVREPIMMWCLRMKLACNYETFGELLDSTGRNSIVEESHRDKHWGTIRIGRYRLQGSNRLGLLLRDLRGEYRGKSKADMLSVVPPTIPDFRLFRRRVRIIVIP